jgi:hypothetical protein
MIETKTLPFTTEDIIKAAGMHPLKARNIYIYGSQVYGTARSGSDWDIILVGANLLAHEEIRKKIGDELLNIHIITPDKFSEGLKNHDIMNLECIFAPSWAKLQEKISMEEFQVNPKKLIKNNLAQSFSSWKGGKMKLNDGDIYRGLKSIFHSLKMLMFAIQILEHGKIVDYPQANYLYSEINDCDEVDWDYFKEKYLPFKVQLEEKLKSYGKSE